VDTPPTHSQRVQRRWERLEELSDLTDSELQERLEQIDRFTDRVYWLVRQIPAGRVATYGQIATYGGSPRAARAVGHALKGTLDEGITLPWHRVINAKGGISGRDDPSRARLQRDRLESEGIVFSGQTCDLDAYRWEPDPLFWEVEPT